MKNLSEQLSDLSVRVKRTEDVVDAVSQRNRERLTQQQEALRSATTSGSQHLAEAGRHAEADWDEARSAVRKRFDAVRTAAGQHRADRDLARAQRRADRAEADAADAVDFAMYVLDEAEWAVVDAALARADADDLASSERS